MAGQAPDYVPVHRIALACTSCRRKKARCTGTQPTCANCRRLRIECHYPTDRSGSPITNNEAVQPTRSSLHTNSSSVLAKLSSIESALQEFGSQIQSIRADLEQLKDQHAGQNREQALIQDPPRKKQRVISEGPPERSLHPISQHGVYVTEDTMLPRDAVSATVDAYFTYCHNQPYCFFNERTFRQALAQGNVPKHLISAMLATAIRFSSHSCLSSPDRARELAVEYADRSWQSVVADCFAISRKPDITLVQTIALLCLFDFTAGKSRHAAAWVKTGLAVRIAQELGLMQDTAHEDPNFDQEARRRVFWSVYLLDRLVSCGRGRPLAILDASCQLILPCADQAWQASRSEATPSLDGVLSYASGGHAALSPYALVVLAASLLGRSGQYSLQQVNVRGRCHPWDPNSDFITIGADLLQVQHMYELDIPIEQLFHRHGVAYGVVDQAGSSPVILARVIFHLCHCLLNHPFLLKQRVTSSDVDPPTGFLTRAFDTAWQHACQMIELVDSARNYGYVFTASFSGYCVMVASSIVALHAHSEDHNVGTEIEALLAKAFAFLESLGEYWYNATNMASALRVVVDRSQELSQLSDPHGKGPDLTLSDVDLLWSVVDYGEISNKTSTDFGQDDTPTSDVWFESFINLFGAPNSRLAEAVDSTLDPFSIAPL